MAMCYDNCNNNLLPNDLLIDIVERLSLEDYYVFSAVCKSWNSASAATEKPRWLPTRRIPMLLLAEEVAPGSILYDTQYDLNRTYGFSGRCDYCFDDGRVFVCAADDDDDIDVDGDVSPYKDNADYDYDYIKYSVGTSRGLYSLSSMKTYNIELPEAAGKLILSTSKGWLLTLGRDLQINLLHPLLRHQISLPPMLTFPRHTDKRYIEDASAYFIHKVAMSSTLLNEKTDVSFLHHHATLSPIVMAIYGGFYSYSLAFARLGDKVWTDVNVNYDDFDDIVYHRGNFYAVDQCGDVYVCDIDNDDGEGGLIVHKITFESIGIKNDDKKYYLVEPLTGSGLLVIVRYLKCNYFQKRCGIIAKYRTIKFAVWRLHLYYDDNPLYISSWKSSTEENNLGGEAIFVGRGSSFSVSSSEIIKPNSIYFTDDIEESYLCLGGGHDMGIFDMEHGTIEPHFQGKSIHCISPPLWYI